MDKAEKKILIFHSDVSPNSNVDELDILEEAKFISKNLRILGYKTLILPFQLDKKYLVQKINEIRPDAIFNLVESIESDGRLTHIAPSLFDHLNVKYFGCSTESIILASNKLFIKNILQLHQIPTPKYICLENVNYIEIWEEEQFIIKSVWEHASKSMDETKIRIVHDRNEIIKAILEQKGKDGKQYFAEAFIEGREFNVSMLGAYDQVEVLPIAEIKFENFPDGRPKILGYRAKWIEDSEEYKHITRSFDFTDNDASLYYQLKELSLACWKVFGLNGYARIDFRVDKFGNPFVLDINTNPCISPDSEFVAATERAGIPFPHVLEKIMKACNNA